MTSQRGDGAGETAPDPAADAREAYVEAVLSIVEAIPPGRVAAYGDIADRVGTGGPRQVGRVMSLHGAAVCWWRVLRADGRPARGLESEALSRLRAEGVPIRDGRVVMREARWLEGAGDLLPPDL